MSGVYVVMKTIGDILGVLITTAALGVVMVISDVVVLYIAVFVTTLGVGDTTSCIVVVISALGAL